MVAGFLVSGLRRIAARLDTILCVLGKSEALISNLMSVSMLRKVAIHWLFELKV